jgi:hypothetical protein
MGSALLGLDHVAVAVRDTDLGLALGPPCAEGGMPPAVLIEVLLQGYMAAHEAEQQQQQQQQQGQGQQGQEQGQQHEQQQQPWRLALLCMLQAHPQLHAPLVSRLAQLLLEHGPGLDLQQVRYQAAPPAAPGATPQ